LTDRRSAGEGVMTRRRWSRLGELFAGALRVDPAERQAWLRGACGEDEGLRAAAARILDQAGRVVQDGLPQGPEPSAPAPGPRGGGPRPRPSGAEPIGDEPAGHVAGARGFSPKAAIAAGPRRAASSEPKSVVRARLRELPMIYVLFLAMASFWRWGILGDDD